MRAQIYYKNIALSDSSLGDINFEELRPDNFGHWVDPSHQDFNEFIPIAHEGNSFNPSSLPFIFKEPFFFDKENNTYNPFLGVEKNTEVSISDCALSIQSILSDEFSVFVVHKDQNPYQMGKHTLCFSINTSKTESNLSLDSLAFFRDYYSNKIYLESENHSEVESNQKIKGTIQRIIKDSKNLPVLHKYTLQLFDTLPREFHLKLEEKKLQFIDTIIQKYADKISQLRPHALERKGIFERIANELYSLNEEIHLIRKSRLGWKELIENAKNISEDDVFCYIYAVMHSTNFKTKFSSDLKRNWPRFPLYNDFFKWVSFGERLMQLHLRNFSENEVADVFPETSENEMPEKINIKLNKDNNTLKLTKGVSVELPSSLIHYKIGDFMALEWLLKLFKTYQKENSLTFQLVKSMLNRVIHICSQTQKIIAELDRQKA